MVSRTVAPCQGARDSGERSAGALATLRPALKTLRRLLFWSLLLGGLVLGGVLLTREQPPTVAVHTVARGVVEATVANTRAGTVQANRRARVPAPAPDRLAGPQVWIERLPIHIQRQLRAGLGGAGELDRLVLGDWWEVGSIVGDKGNIHRRLNAR